MFQVERPKLRSLKRPSLFENFCSLKFIAALPPRSAADLLANPVRGTVIEIGYVGPDEYNDPPYPSVANLKQLQALGVQVVSLGTMILLRVDWRSFWQI